MPTQLEAFQIVGSFFVVLIAFAIVFMLARPLWLPIWKVFKRIQQFLEDWFGEPADPSRGLPERPGAMKRLAQLENNSGSTMKDKVEENETRGKKTLEVVTQLQDQIAAVQIAVEQATIAAGVAVNEAGAGRRMAKEAEKNRQTDVVELRKAIVNMKDDLEDAAAKRMVDALDLLAEHGGPDLRPHMPMGPPHKHVVIDDETTGPHPMQDPPDQGVPS